MASSIYGTGDSASASTVGGQVSVNLGSETVRVQLAVTGLLLAAFVALYLLHRHGFHFAGRRV